jgi:hypothetical protein
LKPCSHFVGWKLLGSIYIVQSDHLKTPFKSGKFVGNGKKKKEKGISKEGLRGETA